MLSDLDRGADFVALRVDPGDRTGLVSSHPYRTEPRGHPVGLIVDNEFGLQFILQGQLRGG
jgi:hypothetical protein